MNLDSITLDDILSGFEKQNKDFDTTKINNEYHTLFPEELKKYSLVKPSDVETLVDKGNIIRYVRKNKNNNISISNATIVIKKIYKDYDIDINDNNVFDHLLVTSLHNKKNTWKLYPANQYIFLYSPYIGDQKISAHMRKIADQKGIKVKNITLSPKTRRKIFQNMGMTNKEINLDDNLDKKIGDLLESHTKKKVSYGGVSVNQENLDATLNMILSQHNKIK